jgi:fused signal recognition particle receptor
MKKTLGEKILDLFKKNTGSREFYDQLEEDLIESDIGALTSMEIIKHLEDETKKRPINSKEQLQLELKKILLPFLHTMNLDLEPDTINMFLILGVNGVGKTTSIAKLADFYSRTISKDKILMAAGDTFRAAAIDQLKIHGERTGIKVIHQEHGSDPGAVIFDTIESAKARNSQLILADTAGRMHTKANLVKELQKIDKIVVNKLTTGRYRKLLVIDATTGQNGLQQAQTFQEAVGIDGIILTKYDSTAKGGILVALGKTLNLPIAFLGTGEKKTDFRPFDPEQYLDELLGIS